MKEYTINVRTDGSAVIASDPWSHSCELEADPFVYKEGMKVVDIFSEVVTIKEILKFPPSRPGCCPEWNIRVEENGNTYRYTEIAGPFVCELTKEQLDRLVGKKEESKEREDGVFEVGDIVKTKKGIMVPIIDKGEIKSVLSDGWYEVIHDGFKTNVRGTAMELFYKPK